MFGCNRKSWWWFQIFFRVGPLLWGTIQFDLHISNVLKLQTRKSVLIDRIMTGKPAPPITYPSQKYCKGLINKPLLRPYFWGGGTLGGGVG